MKTKYLLIFLLLFSFFQATAYATETNIKTFKNGSYQQLLVDYKDKALVLIIWSVTCSSCLKEMAFISKLHQQQPELNLVMLTVDDNSVSSQINEILSKFKLEDLENWVFAEENSAKLRFEIDSSWYGELPRTYFFNKKHQRTGVSGVISEAKYQNLLSIIKD
jgi:thiol-disulfide isomerase/thioredoxin